MANRNLIEQLENILYEERNSSYQAGPRRLARLVERREENLKDEENISKLGNDLSAALQALKEAQRQTGGAVSQYCLIADNCKELEIEVRKAREALECEKKKSTSLEGELSKAKWKITSLKNIINGSGGTAKSFETSIDFLSLWIGNDGSAFRCPLQGCNFSSYWHLNHCFDHFFNKHFDEFKSMHEEVRIGIYQVLEGRNEPDWVGRRIYHEDRGLVGSERLYMKEFCARFLKECRGTNTRFACEYICAGGAMNSVADFLKHFNDLHPEMLGMLYNHILEYIRQPHLQASLLKNCVYETPSPNDTLKQEVTGMEAESQQLVADLEGAHMIIKSKATEVKDLQREIEHMKPCFRVGRAICDRKMQKQLYTRERDKATISLGNSAAHHGTVKADASLFAEAQVDGYKRCQDPEAFILMYGIDPQFVIRFEKNVGFIEMLDWRGSMKDFFKGDSYLQTTFHSSYDACMQRIRDTWFMEPFEVAQKALNEAMKTADFLEDVKVMKQEYEAAKQRNQRETFCRFAK